VSLGLLHIVEDFGIRPDLVGGHSFGELTALCAAGRIDVRALAMLSLTRGSVMADCADRDDPGAMLAVFAPIDHVAELIQAHGLDVIIANKNAPRQSVLSGPTAEIEQAAALFGREQIGSSRLPVSAAFHSRFVAEAQTDFQQVLATVDLKPSKTPAFANATGLLYPDDPAEAKELLARQLSQPVEFVSQIEAMYEMGGRTFLEVGPGARLTGLVRSILEGRQHWAIAVDALSSEGDQGNLAGLAVSLANLAALGYPVELVRWDEGNHVPESLSESRKQLTVKVCGAHPEPSRVSDLALDHSAQGVPDDDVSQPAIARLRRNSTPNSEAQSSTTAKEPGNSPGSHDHYEKAPRQRAMNAFEHDHHSVGNGRASPVTCGVRPGVLDKSPTATAPLVPPSNGAELAEAIRQTQENLAALQRLAEKTAQIHRQFLEGQAATQHTFQSLLQHHQRLTAAVLGRGTLQDFSPQLVRPISEVAGTIAVLPDSSGTTDLGSRPPEAVNGSTTIPAFEIAAHSQTPSPAAVSAEVLREVVAEKTGYPVEMLELEMQLDDDLGIDSIKRVEIFSALQERFPEAPAVKPEHLGSLRTLRQIAEFLASESTTHQALRPSSGVKVPVSAGRNGDTHTQAVAALASGPAAHSADVLRQVVAEKTGYPVEMLELEMQLDDDLGIDSIKRVEIFSALQERFPEAPAVKPEHLGSLRTLRQIADFLNRVTTDQASPLLRTRAAVPVSSVASGSTLRGAEVLCQVVAEKTGYPVEMLELDMQLDDDLGIDSIKRVEVFSALQERLPEAPAVKPEHLGSLRTLRQIAEFLDHQPSAGGTVAAPLACLAPRVSPLGAGPSRELASITPGSEIWVIDDGSPLATAIRERLMGRGHEVRLLAPEQTRLPEACNQVAGLIILAKAKS
jgi:acyl transferase domain-containing protein